MGKDIRVKKVMTVRLDDVILLYTIRCSYEYVVHHDYGVDSDEEDPDSKGYHYSSVEVRQPPICIYNNHNFVNAKLEKKYKSILDTVLADNERELSDVKTVYKTEEREYY